MKLKCMQSGIPWSEQSWGAVAGFQWWLNTQPYDAAHTAARHAGGSGACGRGEGRGEGEKGMIRFLSRNLSPANSGLTEGKCSAGDGNFCVNYFILFLFLPFFRLDSSVLDKTPPPPPTIPHHIAWCSCLTPTQPSTVSKESEERLTHLIFNLPSDWQENYPRRDFSIYFQIEGVTACLSSLPPPSFFILSFLTLLLHLQPQHLDSLIIWSFLSRWRGFHPPPLLFVDRID